MKNNRTLFPPLFGEIPTGGGGGGSGSKIQLSELPEASLEYKDRIVQYIGATTETLTNGYFYKCVEHTTTEGETITVSYSWDNVPTMEEPLSGLTISETETKIGTYGGEDLYAILIPNSKVTVNFGSGTTWVSSDNTPVIKELIQAILRYEAGDYSASMPNCLGYDKKEKTIEWTGHISLNAAIYASAITSIQLILIYTKESEV